MLLLHLGGGSKSITKSPISTSHASGDDGKKYLPGDKIESQFNIFYVHDGVSIDTTYLDNVWQLDTIKRYLATSPVIDSIVIYSYASPEGTQKTNERLAKKRGETAMRFIRQYSKQEDLKIIIKPTTENWQDLIIDIEANYDKPDKQKVLKILKDPTIDDNVRETLLKNQKYYKYILRNHFPRLRKATWKCTWIVPEPEPREIVMMAAVTPPAQDTMDIPHRGGIIVPPFPEPPVIETVEKDRYQFALKTNLLYDVVTALNAEIEIPIGKRVSIMVEDVFPWWTGGPNGNKYALQAWHIGVEPRFWIKPDDYLHGHFIGLYGATGKADLQYDFDLCYQNYFWSAGLTYGYALPIGKRLHMEFSISAGFMQADYQHYQPGPGYEDLYIDRNLSGKFSWIGPTKAKISLVLPIDIPYKKKIKR